MLLHAAQSLIPRRFSSWVEKFFYEEQAYANYGQTKQAKAGKPATSNAMACVMLSRWMLHTLANFIVPVL